MSLGPFYTALVDPGVSFNPAVHNVEDLEVFSADLEHTEGSKPTLKLTVRNPQIGLLNPSRKVNLWFSWYNKSLSAIEPLFFGRLVGIPTNVIGTKVELMFIADPADYLVQKQAIAELKKRRPNYDPLFLDAAHRDDPDSILEGYSELWHVDRITHVVTTSDIIQGEDGILVFAQEDAFYNSVTINIGQAPLTLVEIDAQVQWAQKYTGFIDMGPRVFQSLNGDAILGDFPQPGASLGSGWSVDTASIVDVNGTATIDTVSGSSSWTNKEKEHENGDCLSSNVSWSIPRGESFRTGARTKLDQQFGFLDPFAVDDGDPKPTNIPPHINASYSWIIPWTLKVAAGGLVLRYDADRARTERLVFQMRADLQEITTIQDVPTNTEIISLQGANVDLPLFDFDMWQSVAGQAVTVGTAIQVPVSFSPLVLKPNYQICIVPGTAGTTEPSFSNLVGVHTTDGSVVWAGLGEQAPAQPIDWSPGDSVPAGLVIQPKAQIAQQYNDLVAFYPTPLTGTSIAVDKIIMTPDGASFQICTAPGTTDVTAPIFSNTPGTETIDGSVHWRCIGPVLNDGTTQWIALNSGTTGPQILGVTVPPPFNGPVGTQIVDGSVTWQSLGSVGSFIGIPIGDVSRRSYFPTDRGLWSLEYCICIGRAHLLMKSRCVKITFECPAERITHLTCRRNAQLFDPRIPGGQAIGKITAYTFKADGNTGKIICSVQFECAIGKATTVSPSAGTADYIDDDYIEDGYFEHIGEVIQVASGPGDIGYTPPSDAVNDDGLVFPLTYSSAVLFDAMIGDPNPDLTSALVADTAPVPLDATASFVGMPANQEQGGGNVTKALQANPYHWEFHLTPLTGQNFEDEFVLTVTDLVVPKGIDLSAEAS